MRKIVLSFFFISLSAMNVTYAIDATNAPVPKDSTTVEKGEELHNASCISCHSAKYPNDPDMMYSRQERTVQSYASLANRVQVCGTRAVDTGWFDDEFDAVTTYLNTEFYHFDHEQVMN